jgi:uncharacterized protein (TIGR00255 family)
MLQSMTGFASQTLIIDQEQGQHPLHLTIYLKSLNSRFFETNCKIPSSLTAVEIDLIKILKRDLHRGQVYVTIHLHNPNSLIAQIDANTTVVDNYIEAIHKIQKNYPQLTGELNLAQVLRLPNVFDLQETGLSESTKEKILQACEKLTEELVLARNQEGAMLLLDLQTRLSNMQQLLSKIEIQAAQNSAQKKLDMQTKIEQFAQEIKDENLLEMQKANLYNGLDRIDVHEELVRFTGHLQKLNQCLTDQNLEKGKTLDFTLQECNREINTIAAKANSLEINTLAIEVKVEIEKARQQVQNII